MTIFRIVFLFTFKKAKIRDSGKIARSVAVCPRKPIGSIFKTAYMMGFLADVIY